MQRYKGLYIIKLYINLAAIPWIYLKISVSLHHNFFIINMYIIEEYGAPWCSQCKMQLNEFKKNSISAEIKSINVDELDDEAIDKLQLKSIPVILLKKDNEILNRWNGFTKSQVINDYIESIKN